MSNPVFQMIPGRLCRVAVLSRIVRWIHCDRLTADTPVDLGASCAALVPDWSMTPVKGVAFGRMTGAAGAGLAMQRNICAGRYATEDLS